MASTLESIPTYYNQAIQKLEKSCELTALLRSHLGVVLKDDMDSQFGYMFEEISHTLALSREILTKSDQNLLSSKVTTSQLSEGARTNKRKRDDKSKDSQRRKCNNKRTELTPVPDHDGFQWRKYGQKKILNQSYPRCYYRCTYHHDLKCMAAKQVQQYNDENPPLFEVTYFDEHTCNIPIPRSEPTSNQNILDFSGKLLPESYLSSESICRRKEEEALVSCLTDVIRGYNSGILENSVSCSTEVIRGYNGGTSENSNEKQNQLKSSNESSITIDDDASSIENFLTVDDFPVVDGLTLNPDWLEQDNTQFFLVSLPLI